MKRSSAGSFSLIIGVLLIIGIVVAMVFVGNVVMGEIVGTSYGNVDVTVHISGNDVVVSIIGGEDASSVTGLHTYIDGAPETFSESNYQYNVVLGKPVVFSGIASGIVGSRFVIVEAIFDDESVSVIHYARLQFT